MEKNNRVKLFSNDLEAVFLRRPNRFLIIAEHDGKEIPCHCPNPGRLIEFFGFRGYDMPGIKLILEKREPQAADGTGKRAKTSYTAVGLYYQDSMTGRQSIVPLFSSRANKAAEKLVLREIIPDIKEIQPEFTIGNSRFDFLVTDKKDRRHLVEVKACSLIEYGTAMFPDAPSERALKHLEELAQLSMQGYLCHVLFVIVHGSPNAFIPNLHTDPALSAGLARFGRVSKKNSVQVHAALLRLDKNGDAVLVNSEIPVDLGHGKLAESNSGSYLIVLELPQERDIEVASLGKINFKPGWYVYAGSAMKNLKERINRHLRKIRKQKHWHIDYLTPCAAVIKGLPVYSYQNLECNLSQELLKMGGIPIKNFGSSDCKNHCPAHLYYFPDSPLNDRGFINMFLRFRHKEFYTAKKNI